MKCSKEKFIRTWFGSDSKEEVSEKTGLAMATVTRYAWQMRRQGVELKLFKDEEKGTDWQKLQDLAKQLGEKTA